MFIYTWRLPYLFIIKVTPKMASFINGHATTTDIVHRAEIEAVQTVPPSKITVPRKVRQVSSDVSGVAGGCVHVVLYYEKASQGDSGSLHAGWTKESLAGALSEQPLLAGRLQKGESVGDHEEAKNINVVSNDAGARLVEARIGVTIAEFLLEDRKEAEAELVFWKDIDQLYPQFCPLFYVQVTKFKCGGYSFGISCSLLLADIFLKENFLKKWVDIHRNLVAKNGIPEMPLFYLPNLKKDISSSSADIISSSPNKNSCQITMIFSVVSDEKYVYYSEEDFNTLAMLSVEEAESKLGSNLGPDFSLMFATEPGDMVKIEKCSKREIKPKLSVPNQIDSSGWDDFGANELEFWDGNRAVRLSHWIGSVSGELVLAIPYCSSNHGVFGMKIVLGVQQ